MSNYKLQRVSHVRRNGEVIYTTELVQDRIEIHVPAIIICLTLSIIIWLYILGIESKQSTTPPAETVPPVENGVCLPADNLSALSDEG